MGPAERRPQRVGGCGTSTTISRADDVGYAADGRIAAHGTHDELMASVPAYRQLVEAFEADRPAPAGGLS